MTHPIAADGGPAPTGVGGPKVAARQGVLSACRPDPHPADGRTPIAWLHITAPGRGTVPTATSKCACGGNRSAVGHRQVNALIAEHTDHRLCPLPDRQKESAAA